MPQVPPLDCDGCARVDPERAARLIEAILENVDVWVTQANEIADACPPGAKSNALHLVRNMAQTRLALRRLSGLDDRLDDSDGA